MFEFKVKSPHVTAMWYACKYMLEYQIETPYSDIEIIKLMEYLSSKQKKTTKEYKLKVLKADAQIIWEFIKTVMDNEMLPNPEQLPTFFEAMEMLAQKLDGQTAMSIPPFQLIQGGKR